MATKKQTKKNEEVLPDEICGIADDLSVIVEKHFEDFATAKPKKTTPGSRTMEWGDIIGENRPANVEEWSWRDVASWFSAECKKFFIPFVIKYERDIGIIKDIHSDLSSVGRKTKGDVKDFISWAFENQNQVIDSQHGFTLSSIRSCINMYLQKQLIDIGDDENILGIDLVKEMRLEYIENKTVGILKKYGIPLSVAFLLKMKPDFPLEKIENGIRDRLRELIDGDRLEFVQSVAEKSITSSPYPDCFQLLDWRDKFLDCWDKSFSTSKKWWNEDDYNGRPYKEYDDLKE